MASDTQVLRPARLRDPLTLTAGIVMAGVLLTVLPHDLPLPELVRQLLHWTPFLAEGFAMNVLISLWAMGLGTVLGLVIAVAELSPYRLLRWPALSYVGIFRNAPLLVLIFAASYALPFEVKLFGTYVQFPDWVKAALGLMLPASAHIAEIFRGAIQSIPHTQWESAASLGFGRGQTLRWIILPQCLKRALPPWMNLYSTIAMGTSLASLAGVNDLLHAANSASQSVHRTDFTIAVFPLVLLCFFAYCYPISRLTRRLERRFAVH